jgi:cytoskeletal protein CcmA (bactofilin family)
MFKNKPVAAASPIFAETPARPKPRTPSVPSIISADMTVQGNLHSLGDVQVEGAVVGDIAAAKLVIADGGTVTGNISAQDVRICGALNGSVRANMVTLTATARVLGDVHHELLTIETGGRLEGLSRRLVAEVAAPDVPEAPVALSWQDQPAAHEHGNGHDHGNHDHGNHDHGH